MFKISKIDYSCFKAVKLVKKVKWAAMVYYDPLFIGPHYDGIQIQINNSFVFKTNNSLPCQDLNPGPPSTKHLAYQCATVLPLLKYF